MFTLMATEEISKYIDIGLTSFFILIIFAFVIAAFVGYKRGIFRATFGFLYVATLITIALCTLKPIVDVIGGIDLSSFLPYKTIILTNPSTSQSYNVAISSLYQTLEDCIRGLFTLYHVEGSSAAIMAFTSSVMMLIVFFIQMLLICTLGALFGLILWHLIFKRLVPKIARRKTRLKFLSMGIRCVQFIVVGALFLAPLSSLVNVANNIYQNSDKENNNELVTSEIGTFLDVYNNSVFAQAFFNWTVNDDGLTIDAQIMNDIITSTVDNVSISIINEISNLGDAALTIMNGLFFDQNGGTNVAVDYTYFLSEDVINSLFASLQNSNLIMLLLPIATTIAVNSGTLDNVIDSSLLDLSDFEWDNEEIDTLHTMVLDVINSGILDNFFDPETGEVRNVIYVGDLVEDIFSTDNYQYFQRILLSIDDSTLLSRLLPTLIYTILENDNFATMRDYLPNSWDELNDIQWGFELSVVYDSIYRMNLIDDRFIPCLIKMSENTSSSDTNPVDATSYIKTYATKKGENNLDDNQYDLLSIVLDNINPYRNILLGSVDTNGNLKNVDANGYTVVYDKSNNLIPGRRYNLFDLKLIDTMFMPLCNLIKDSLVSAEKINFDEAKFDKAINSLYEGKKVKNFKLEFHHIFDCLEILSSNPDVLNYINGDKSFIPEGGTIADVDSELIDTLATALPKVDESVILTSVIFPIFEDLMFEDTMRQYFENVGLNPSTFDFECENTGYELAKFLGSYDDIVVIMDIMNNQSLSGAEMVARLGENSESIANVLDVVYDCQVINPTADNANFFDVLENVFVQTNANGLTFKREQLEQMDLKWNNSRTSSGDFFRDKNGNPIYDGEIGYFAEVVRVCSQIGILEIVDNPDFDLNQNVGQLETKYHVSTFIKTAADSTIFRLSLADFFNAQLEESGLIDIDNGVSFDNVNDWDKEADVLSIVLLSIDKMQLNLSNFDISQVKDVVSLNDMLHALSDSGIFKTRDGEYLLSKFLFDKLKTGFSDAGYDLLKDPESDSGSSPTYNLAESDFAAVSSYEEWHSLDYEYNFDTSSYVDSTYSSYWDNPQFESDYQEYFIRDEIGRIVYVIYTMKDINFDNVLSSPSSSIFKSLHAINNAETLRMCIYNLFEVVSDEVASSGSLSSFVDLSLANTEYLIGCGQDNRSYEIDLLEKIYGLYDTINSPEYEGIFTSGFDFNLFDDTIIDQIEIALDSLNDSYVYHRAGPNEEMDLTVFQSTMHSIIGVDQLSSFIYNSNSPKDIKLGLIDGAYSSASEKVDYLVSIYFSSDGVGYDYDAQKNEISSMLEVVRSFVGARNSATGQPYPQLVDENGQLTFDFAQVDFANQNNILAIQYVLTNLNNSNILFDIVPNGLDISFESLDGKLPNLHSLSLDDANIFYPYLSSPHSLDQMNFQARYTSQDIDLIVSLLQEANNYLNEQKSAIPNFNNLDNLDYDGFNYLLDELSNSPLFHTAGLSYTIDSATQSIIYTASHTVYQDLYLEILLNDGLSPYLFDKTNNPKDAYNASLYTNVNEKADYIVQTYLSVNASSDYLTSQNDLTTNILRTILGDGSTQYPGIDVNGIDFTNIDVDAINTEALESSLKLINLSDVFYDLDPNLLHHLFTLVDERIAEETSGSTKQIDFSYVNEYYHYFYNEEVGISADYSRRYTDHDFKLITYLVNTVQDYLSDPENESMFSSFELKDLNIPLIKDMLKMTNESNLTHRGMEKTDKDLTFFQHLLAKIYQTDDMKAIFFSSTSPKDQSRISNGYYSDAQSKTIFVIKYYMDYDDDSDLSLSFVEQAGEFDDFDVYDDENNLISAGTYGEIGYICDFLKVAQELNSIRFETIELDQITGEMAVRLLSSLNNTSTLYDCVPNIVEAVSENINSSLNNEYVNFADATPFFNYYLDNPSSPTFTAKYPESEILNFGTTIDDFNNLLGVLGDDFNGTFDDFSVLDETTIGYMKSLTVDLYNSYTYHRMNEYLDNPARGTVFEQFVMALVKNSQLDSLLYDASSPKDTIYSTSDQKLISKVKAMTQIDISTQTTSTSPTLIGRHDSWAEELDSLFTFFLDIRNTLADNSSMLAKNMDNISFSTLSPDELSQFLIDLNQVDIVSDCVDRFVKNGFNSLGLTSNSMYNDVDYNNYYLSQTQYYENGVGEISNIKIMLDSFVVTNDQGEFDHYSSFNINDFTAADSLSFKPIINYLSSSLIYSGKVDNIEAKGVFMYNVLHSLHVDDFISGVDENEKLSLLTNLFHAEGFNSNSEGEALNALFNEISNFDTQTFYPNVFTSVTSVVDSLLLGIERSYDALGDNTNQRAYFVSDLMGNILTDMMEAEYKQLALSGMDYLPVDGLVPSDINHIDADTYSRLNVYEHDGLKGVISLVNGLTDLSFTKDEITQSFTLMGAKDGVDMAANSGYGNSRIASIYYLSKLYPVLDFDLLFPEDQLKTYAQIHSTDELFYFEEYGAIVSNYLGV